MLGKAILHYVVFVAAIGALNWGLVGAFDKDLVKMLAEAVDMPRLAQVLYIIIGVAGALALVHSLQEMAAGR